MIQSKPRAAAQYGAALAVALMTLTGCSSGASGLRSMSTASAPSPEALTWSECGKNLECTTIEVPQEYTEPAGDADPARGHAAPGH